MYTDDVTWGELRAFHKLMEDENSTSPDDLLASTVFAQKAEGKGDDELVFDEGDPTIVYSVTTDEDRNTILEFVVADEVEGRIAYRTGGKWEELDGEEYPETIYEVPMYDISPTSVDWVTKFWDEKESDEGSITLEDIKGHLK